MKAIFWSSVSFVFYTYFGYPVVLFLISLKKSKDVRKKAGYVPRVSLIITVHNEESRVLKKIRNTQELDYPRDLMDIIFASDASADSTDEIVRRYSGQGIRLVRSSQRKGKEYAQKKAIETAAGDVIVFSDVATMLEPGAITSIVSNFADETIGCVSSEDRFVDRDGNVGGEGAYVRYEMWLRSLESKAGSVVGLSGSFFAARKDVCRRWPTDIPSDFNTLLNAVRSGLRGINDSESVGIYENIRDESREFERKVRTVTRGISALMRNREMLNPFNYGMFSWQLFSHKLLRWCVPFFLVSAFVSNIYLACRKKFYAFLMMLQLVFYALAFAGRYRSPSFLRLPFFFTEVNRAIAAAWMKYLTGHRYRTWNPSRR